MQSSFPMVISYFIKFYYYVPSLMFAGIPIPCNGVELYENLASIQNQLNSFNDQNWLEPSY